MDKNGIPGVFLVTEEFQDAASKHPSTFLIVEQQSISDSQILEKYGVNAFPTFLKLKNGAVAGEYKGSRTSDAFLEWSKN